MMTSDSSVQGQQQRKLVAGDVCRSRWPKSWMKKEPDATHFSRPAYTLQGRYVARISNDSIVLVVHPNVGEGRYIVNFACVIANGNVYGMFEDDLEPIEGDTL